MKKYFAIALPLLLLLACQTKKEQPVTNEEATAFAKEIVANVKRGEKDFLNQALDLDLFSAEVAKVAGDENDRSLKREIKSGMKSQDLSKEIYKNLGKNGLYEFLKQYQKDGHQHVIFRLYGEGGINYHDYALVKYDDKVKAKDMYIYLTGQNLSATFGELFNTVMAQSEQSSKSIDTYGESIKKIRNLMRQEQYRDANQLLEKQPLSLRQTKSFQLIHLQITSQMDTTMYANAIQEYNNLYGSDPTSQFVLFDDFFLRGDYKKSMQILDRVDSSVHDPLLNYYRALIYTKEGKGKEAVSHLEKVYKDMPYFDMGLLELLANYIELGRYNDANHLIAAYRGNRTFDQAKLEHVKELYAYEADQLKW